MFELRFVDIIAFSWPSSMAKKLESSRMQLVGAEIWVVLTGNDGEIYPRGAVKPPLLSGCFALCLSFDCVRSNLTENGEF